MKIYRLWVLTFLLLIGMTNAHSANEEAIFAGGCFWCMEPPFDETPGVLSTTSGYIGGSKANPTYKEVSSGKSGHYEAIKIVFDPKIVNFNQLLSIFWKNIDPHDGEGQFCDRGQQYEAAIFHLNQAQQDQAQASKKKLNLKGTITTKILPAGTFYAAEAYHQDYYKTNPVRYKFYRYKCGRDKRLDEVWKK